MHSRARRNPPELTVTPRGSGRGGVLLGTVLSVTYRHAESAGRTPYRHEFAAGDELYAMPDGSIQIRNARGRRLWADRVVDDNA